MNKLPCIGKIFSVYEGSIGHIILYAIWERKDWLVFYILPEWIKLIIYHCFTDSRPQSTSKRHQARSKRDQGMNCKTTICFLSQKGSWTQTWGECLYRPAPTRPMAAIGRADFFGIFCFWARWQKIEITSWNLRGQIWLYQWLCRGQFYLLTNYQFSRASQRFKSLPLNTCYTSCERRIFHGLPLDLQCSWAAAGKNYN